jgi:hypothetical protein
VLGFNSTEFKARLSTVVIARRAVLDAILNIQATVISHLRRLWLLSLSFPFSFARGLRIGWRFELQTRTATNALIYAADVQNDCEQN